MYYKRGTSVRNIKINKSGASHFEVIISFLLFFTFVVFLLIYIRPHETNILSASVVAALHDELEGEIETNLTQIFLKADAALAVPDEDGCFYVTLPGEITAFGFSNRKSVVRDLDFNNINSKLEPSSGSLHIDSDKEFYRVFVSPDFEQSNLNCEWPLNDYVIGSVSDSEIVYKGKLDEIKQEYDNNYESLKQELNFPEAFDFAIVTEPDIIIMERPIPDEAEVMARDYLKPVLFEDAIIDNVKFTLKVW